MTGKIVELHLDSVGYRIMVYKQGGFGTFCQYNYGINKSGLD